jgi:hypothetical protein
MLRRLMSALVAICCVIHVSETVRAGPIIRAGFDVSVTIFAFESFALSPAPANFFGPGSDPFDGTIHFAGREIDSFLGVSLRGLLVDTIVSRPADAVLSGPGSSATVPVQMVALSYTTLAPLVVTYDGGTRSELWTVDAVAPNNPPGTMTIRQLSHEGGLFDSTFPIHPILTFTRISDAHQIQIAQGTDQVPGLLMSQTDIPWVFEQTVPVIARVEGLTTNFVPGYSPEIGRIPMVGFVFSDPPGAWQDQSRGEHGHWGPVVPEINVSSGHAALGLLVGTLLLLFERRKVVDTVAATFPVQAGA